MENDHPPAPFVVIFTDLDGTLLDHDSYSCEEAEEALESCRRSGVPVVLTSSKTRAEMDRLRRGLRLEDPFISENGGGIFLPGAAYTALYPLPSARLEEGLWKVSIGRGYAYVVKQLHELAQGLGWSIRGFSDMTVREISLRTGLDEESSRLAAMREYDEPFVITAPKDPPFEVLVLAAAERGLTVTRGGRFCHLHGSYDKGCAMKTVLSWYKRTYEEVFSVALGDSQNDFPMLELADCPVLIRSPGKIPAGPKIINIPRLQVTLETGPKAWNSAVLSILGRKRGEMYV